MRAGFRKQKSGRQIVHIGFTQDGCRRPAIKYFPGPILLNKKNSHHISLAFPFLIDLFDR